jgi:hypothetical protein
MQEGYRVEGEEVNVLKKAKIMLLSFLFYRNFIMRRQEIKQVFL